MSANKHELAKSIIDFIIKDIASDQDIDELKPGDDLLESSLVDSLGVMRLTTFIEQEFGYSVPPEDIVIENFMTVNAIIDYLAPKLSKNVN